MFSVQDSASPCRNSKHTVIGSSQSPSTTSAQDPSLDSFKLQNCLDEQSIRIDTLEVELDQHKEAMIEKLKELRERDMTIKTQCFHIVSVYESLQKVMEEKMELNSVIAELYQQLEAYTKHDWQSSRLSKRRRF